MTDSSPSKTVLTPKQAVLKKWPAAFSWQWKDGVCIYRPFLQGNICMGSGKTAAQAWADALANMRSGKV